MRKSLNSLLSFEIKKEAFKILPFKSAIDSMTASRGGGSNALLTKSLISPSFNNFILKASSCKGVRRISGVACSANLQKDSSKITASY